MSGSTPYMKRIWNSRNDMADKDQPTRIYPCPQCRKPSRWDDNPWRPFCSERCKLIDLGDWASERHAIPGEPTDPIDDFDDLT